MVARPNSGKGSREEHSGASPDARRKELRYRFAQMLTDEKFSEALDEAVLARRNGEILPADFEFVVNIVKAAARLGRVKIEPQRFPVELLPATPPVAPSVPAAPGAPGERPA
jgi:hypothetical protein